MESKESIEEQAKAIPKTAVLIAETLMEADVSFPVCMAALTIVIAEIAIEMGFSHLDLISTVDEASKIVYKKHKEKGGNTYVQ